jgi:hypothetical protein
MFAIEERSSEFLFNKCFTHSLPKTAFAITARVLSPPPPKKKKLRSQISTKPSNIIEQFLKN